ncbi:MAG: glycosyltransferase family 39 protein, partial [Planctomycetes bacterium]|nr:glycosyltransferase family 39 protein [Planctomycetota bacterium]
MRNPKMNEPGSRKSLGKLELGCLIGLILSLVLFHGLTIHIPSLFIDEVEELAVAHGGFWEAVFKPDSMPPAFTILLRLWVRFLSDDEQARWFSVLCHAASVFMAWWFTRSICSVRIALSTALVLAWNPLAIFYGQLIRGYSLYLLLATMLIGLWLVANRTNRLRDWVCFSLVLCLGAYVHYYFVMIPWSMLFVQLCWEKKQSLRSFLIASSVAAIGSLPIVSFLSADFVYQHDLREPRSLSFGAIIYTFVSLVSGYSLGPSQRELQVLDLRNAVIMQSWPILGMIVVSIVSIVILAVPGMRRFQLIRSLGPLMIIPVISIGLLGAFSGITYHVRFVVWLIYPFSLILGLMAESSKNWTWKIAVMILTFSLFSLANYNRLFEDRYKIEDMRSTAKFLE